MADGFLCVKEKMHDSNQAKLQHLSHDSSECGVTHRLLLLHRRLRSQRGRMVYS